MSTSEQYSCEIKSCTNHADHHYIIIVPIGTEFEIRVLSHRCDLHRRVGVATGMFVEEINIEDCVVFEVMES
jgi:hypothetical protein